ncbi:MAG: pentapeptide repeat-containing protein [Caldilineaceae bacterium]
MTVYDAERRSQTWIALVIAVPLLILAAWSFAVTNGWGSSTAARPTAPTLCSPASTGAGDLSGVDLSAAGLVGANLADTDLRGADLYFANFQDADLSRSDLTNAALRRQSAIDQSHRRQIDGSGSGRRSPTKCGAG